MPTRRPKETTPDLFSTRTTIGAPASPAVPEMKGDPANELLSPRHFLPKDLAGSLRRLDDAEIDSLLAAVTAEAKRRNRPSSPRTEKVPARARPRPSRALVEVGAHSLTKGQLNAVRAAFKAGVKLSAIARQFRISQSVVREALASERSDRELGR